MAEEIFHGIYAAEEPGSQMKSVTHVYALGLNVVYAPCREGLRPSAQVAPAFPISAPLPPGHPGGALAENVNYAVKSSYLLKLTRIRPRSRRQVQAAARLR